ncbi:peptidoglycan DD-metalloendopeptidase family protein [Neptuniibacter sp. CAU 1671]|uniref:murein hydrolase activator EnvC family protein n=1 Tax=Neptuniibacter sp. CAU 1671 TaxID=3032593 RepID=UPI0023DBFA76|nr:peptidoglycan DD-metalloendopeptidase family protein [Neptuniibacter sp. CAU 1671]MDF2183061.1 peptidoglycan DD-metalloendopeptidase family protein [Neptuniibacter sp. CAU 1671]
MAVNKATLLLGLMLLLAPLVSISATDKAATQKQIKQLQSRIEKLTEKLRAQEGDSKSVTAALKKTEQEAGQVAREIRQLDQQLASLGGEETDLEGKKARILEDLKQRAIRLEQQIKVRYSAGKQPRLEMLLNQQDPEALDRMLRYHDALSQTLANDIRAFRTQLEALQTTDSRLAETRQAILDRQASLQQELDRLQQLRQQRQTDLAALKKALQQGGGELKQLKLDQTRLQAVLKEIEASFNVATLVADDTPFKTRKGRLAWPVKGRIGRDFGSMQNNISYDGIWIQGDAGQTVSAVHHGRVVFSDWLRGYGLVTILDHGNGYMTLYGYNQTLLREAGDWVAAGDAIATVGDSGGRQETGLYFAVRYKGEPQNPSGWLSRR